MKTIEKPTNSYIDLERKTRQESVESLAEIREEIDTINNLINSLPDIIKRLLELTEIQTEKERRFEEELDAIQRRIKEEDKAINNIINEGLDEIGHLTKLEIHFLSELSFSNQKSDIQEYIVNFVIHNLENNTSQTITISGELITYPSMYCCEFNKSHIKELKGLIPTWQLECAVETIKTHYCNEENWIKES